MVCACFWWLRGLQRLRLGARGLYPGLLGEASEAAGDLEEALAPRGQLSRMLLEEHGAHGTLAHEDLALEKRSSMSVFLVKIY